MLRKFLHTSYIHTYIYLYLQTYICTIYVYMYMQVILKESNEKNLNLCLNFGGLFNGRLLKLFFVFFVVCLCCLFLLLLLLLYHYHQTSSLKQHNTIAVGDSLRITYVHMCQGVHFYFNVLNILLESVGVLFS